MGTKQLMGWTRGGSSVWPAGRGFKSVKAPTLPMFCCLFLSAFLVFLLCVFVCVCLPLLSSAPHLPACQISRGFPYAPDCNMFARQSNVFAFRRR